MGYIAYDAVRRLETLPEDTVDDLDLPDILYMFTNTIVAFDNISHKLTIMHNVQASAADNLDLLYDQAAGVINQILNDLKQPLPEEVRETGRVKASGKIVSNLKKEKFLSAVETCKRYIHDGDIIQAVFSQRLETDFEGDSFTLYRALRIVNPSPYMFYLQFENKTLVGASPEVHVRCYDNTVTIRPIAGTRPRGKTVEEDLLLEQELLADEKEKAEHLMLVDLKSYTGQPECLLPPIPAES
ncbi:Anthranilate synthase component 1 [subsurface metagenome]